MATFPKTVDATTTANTLPPSISLQLRDIDPTQVYVSVVVPASLIRPDPNNGTVPGYGAATFYRLSDLIAYIVATAKGQ